MKQTLLEGTYFSLCFVFPGILVEGYVNIHGSSIHSYLYAALMSAISALIIFYGVYLFSKESKASHNSLPKETLE